MTWKDPIDAEWIRIPVDGVLDLHAFAPRDAVSVVEEYLEVCAQKGILEVKIIHGKGRGVLRRILHGFLETHPNVSGFELDPGPSSWGATWVYLGSSGRESSR